MRVASPVYLDTSALAKIYVAEAESNELESALLGRRDLIVSDLAVTELTSVIARRVREADLSFADAQRLYRRVLGDLAAGDFRLGELTPDVHREAERLLIGLRFLTQPPSMYTIRVCHERVFPGPSCSARRACRT